MTKDKAQVLLKDAHATSGMRTTTGLPSLADHVPQQDW